MVGSGDGAVETRCTAGKPVSELGPRTRTGRPCCGELGPKPVGSDAACDPERFCQR